MNRTALTFVLISLVWTGVMTRPAQAGQTVCGAGDAQSYKRVSKVLTSPELNSFRSTHAITGDSSGLRLLTDSLDQAICEQLNTLVNLGGQGTPAYYTAGGFYFVTAVPQTTATPNRIMSRHVPVVVLDSSLTVRDVLAM